MYAVEFEAPIENGVVYIPKQYQDLQQTNKAKFIVIYDNTNSITKKNNDTEAQLQEFRRLRAKSNNKIKASMDLLSKIDNEMTNDGIF